MNNDSEQLSDEEIVKQTLKDANAIGLIIDRYEAKLQRYIMRLGVKNAEDQRDVLQDIFIKTFRNLNGFDTSMAFSSWIYRIAHNETISWYRRNKVRPEGHLVNDSDEVIDIINSTEESADIVFDKELNKEQVKNALSEIDEKYCEILILRYFEHKEYDEISDILKIPLGTVGTLIYRGKKQLSQKLNRPALHLT